MIRYIWQSLGNRSKGPLETKRPGKHTPYWEQSDSMHSSKGFSLTKGGWISKYTSLCTEKVQNHQVGL